MDLKDVISSVTDKVTEAQNAYRAGHPETSILYFKKIMEEIRDYFLQMSPAEVNALEEATIETAAEIPEEKPAEVPGAPAQTVGKGPVLPASQFGQGPETSKPNQ